LRPPGGDSCKNQSRASISRINLAHPALIGPRYSLKDAEGNRRDGYAVSAAAEAA
jgi:hypothetical protein